jgi:hypothetical protein
LIFIKIGGNIHSKWVQRVQGRGGVGSHMGIENALGAVTRVITVNTAPNVDMGKAREGMIKVFL